MAKKQALGRGLGALIESNDNSSSGGEKVKAKKPVEVKGVDEINIELIEANPYQPRTIFDEEALNSDKSGIAIYDGSIENGEAYDKTKYIKISKGNMNLLLSIGKYCL